MNLPLDEIEKIALEFKWDFLEHQKNIKMVSFVKRDMRINIYISTGTVATCLNHPKQGKTQMFRRNVDLTLLQKIFENPRIHSNKGYQKK
jgi:hypothetical protein